MITLSINLRAYCFDQNRLKISLSRKAIKGYISPLENNLISKLYNDDQAIIKRDGMVENDQFNYSLDVISGERRKFPENCFFFIH